MPREIPELRANALAHSGGLFYGIFVRNGSGMCLTTEVSLAGCRNLSTTQLDRTKNLFNRHRLCQVAWLIDIMFTQDGHMIGQQLQG